MLGDEEDRAEQAEVGGSHRHAGPGEAWVAEHVDVEQRRRRARLVEGEQADEDDPARQGRERDAVQPPVAPAADHAVDEGPEPDDRQRRAQRIEPALLGVPRFGYRVREPGQGDGHDGQVHEEDRAPVEVLEQHAAGQRAEGDADAGRARPHRDRLLPLGGVGEGVGDDRQGRREDEGGADAGDSPHGDQPAGGVDEGRRQAAEAEDHEARGQRPSPPEPVAQRAARQQEAGEHDRVGVDDPLQLARRPGDRPAEGRDGDVEDGGVDRDQHERRAQHGERPPPPGIVRRTGRGTGRSVVGGPVSCVTQRTVSEAVA